MKRLLSLLLSGALLASLGVLPASAAEDSAKDRLARVTLAVKNTLDLDTDRYEDFQGECDDGEFAPVWNLYWSSEDGAYLSISTLEDGTITSYRLNNGNSDSSFSNGWGLPVFPANDTGEAAAQEIAETFVRKTLSKIEAVELSSAGSGDRLNRSGYSFYGKISLNGLPSPLTCSVTVEDGQVVRFRREAAANTFLGSIPAPQAKAEAAKAAADLRSELAVKLEYVRSQEDSNKIVLRYVPEKGLHTFYVDASSGSLLDLTELENGMSFRYKNESAEDGAAPSAAAGMADNGASLSAAELTGVDKLKDVKSASELDAALRAVEAYGLKGYTLSASSYTLDRAGMVTSIARAPEEGEETVVCTLRYTRSDEEYTYLRVFNVDARSGEVRRIYSSLPWDRDAALSQEEAQAKAEAFLKTLCPDRTLALYYAADYEKGNPYYSFTFARTENGIPFSANSYSISIDAVDGSVCRLSCTWDEDAVFDSPAGVISPERALTAWADTYETVLAYRLVPQDLNSNDEAQARLISQGMRRYYGLRLTYGLEREENCPGIDAKSGLPVREEKRTETAVSYTDLAGSSAKADIEKLARYGIGYDCDAFRPGAALTQWDFVCLLASVQGWRLDPAAASGAERDSAYYTAYSLGALTRAERADSAAVTRGALVKMLLNAAGYGSAAGLKGIFTTTYSDQSAIPAGDLGYAAIAQALGMASGTYAAARTATRGEAASMLCRLLERAG